MLGILTLLFFGFGANTFLPSTSSALDHHVPSPPPLCPQRQRYAWPFRSTRQHAVCHRCHFRHHRCFGRPPTAIAVAAVVFVASPLPWLSPSPLLLPSHSPSPQLQSSPPPSTPLPPSLLSPTTAATAAVGSKRWLSALALSAGSQRMASACGFSACLSALALIAWLS